MGDWNITIRGTGSHHNGDRLPSDANRMAHRFAEQLRGAGHTVRAASFADDTGVTDRTPAADFVEGRGDIARGIPLALSAEDIAHDAGRRAFIAYNESKGGLTYDGKPIPPWESLTGEVGEAVKRGWIAAARAVLAG